MLGCFGGYVQDKIPFAGTVQTELDLIHGVGDALEFVEEGFGLFFEFDKGDDQHRPANFGAVEDGEIVFDLASFLELADAFGHG